MSYVSFYDSLRFANWLHNGQGAGSTETGAYTLVGGTPIPTNGLTVTRNSDATIFLTSEDEWYKAAYYDASTLGYSPYPFADGFNGAACEFPAGTTTHSANCSGGPGELTDAGDYEDSPGPNGTFDQGGNVWEWNETIIRVESRGLRGGSYGDGLVPDTLAAPIRAYSGPPLEHESVGFRVASLPEPGPGLLLMLGMLGLAVWRRRSA